MRTILQVMRPHKKKIAKSAAKASLLATVTAALAMGPGVRRRSRRRALFLSAASTIMIARAMVAMLTGKPAGGKRARMTQERPCLC